ncbi:MAG: hypothetical protein SFT92_02275 [Rickettsiales bacterium]|nr:hypothetical protein [Rickettsiales bacterium]
MTLPQRIVDCARSWIGTRFHHQGRLKCTATDKGGVDCLGLLVGIARELELTMEDGTPLSSLDQTDYTLTPDTDLLRQKLAQALLEIDPDDASLGDVLLLSMDGRPQHMGIVSDTPHGYGLIHAYAPSRAVVEHELDRYWRKKIIAAFHLSAL